MGKRTRSHQKMEDTNLPEQEDQNLDTVEEQCPEDVDQQDVPLPEQETECLDESVPDTRPDEESIEKVDRGMTAVVLHVDELPYIERADDEEQAPADNVPETSDAAKPVLNQHIKAGHALTREKLDIKKYDHMAENENLNFMNTVDLSTISTSGRVVLESLQSYMLLMRRGHPMTPQEGCRQQTILYRALVSAINNLDADFPVVFGLILKQFRDHADNMFGMRAFRFIEHIQLHESDRQAFSRLLNMFTLLNDPKTWSLAVNQIDMHRTLGTPITDQGRQRVLNFYNI